VAVPLTTARGERHCRARRVRGAGCRRGRAGGARRRGRARRRCRRRPRTSRAHRYALVTDAVAARIALAALDRNAAGVADLAALGVLLGATLRRAADAELVGRMERHAVMAAAALGDMARLPVALAACAAWTSEGDHRDQ